MSGSKRNVNKAAIIMFAYAGLVVGLSVLAYSIAPEGANASTAIVIGAVAAALMSAMGVCSLMIEKNRKVGMIGIHVGMLLPLVFAIGFLMRIPVAYGSSGVHGFFVGEFERQVAAGARQDTPGALSEFYADAERELTGDAITIPRTDKAYLGRTLTLLFGTSTAAFALLLLSRPKVPKKAPADPFVEPTPAKPSPESASD
ncbi:MAG: hypothetical protein AAFR96_09245 [Planctomycetota bacterium]